ncbi:hypothetical protein [Cohnella nanjingensis]|uniref:Uncharacterized protein n=1 Tax=Cohnella nanjingensis TaxID=1387779 RepID=A0A7X0RQZ5_9BACL|nr:hypothetical protein [Cohnella nanjingensis]MBB6672032.1 hypothetical protein [Cohnella nanjingensis]
MSQPRSYFRIDTFIYVLALIVTVAAVFLTGLPVYRPGHFIFTVGSLLLAETAAYGYSRYMSSIKRSFGKTGPSYLGYGTVIVLYFIAVLGIIVLFSIMLDVSTGSYALIHLIALAIAGILGGFMAFSVKNAEEQEDEAAASVQWVSGMLQSLLSAKLHLNAVSDASAVPLKRSVEELEEKVRYSDPVTHPSMRDTDQLLLQRVQLLADDIQLLGGGLNVAEQSEPLARRVGELSNQVTLRNQQLIQLK